MLQYFPNITGSLTVSGDVIVSGSIATTQGITISGSIDSASYSSNSEKLDNLDSTAFVFTSSFNTYSSSMSTRTSNLESTSSVLTTASASFAVVSSSYSVASGSLSTRVTRIEGNYATTGSNVFMGAQTVCANITSTGTIIAQTLNVQQVTSSVVYSSGSNVFGCSLANTQQFTGSVTMTGSLAVFTAGTSPEFQVVTGGTIKGNALTDVHQVTGSLRITGSVISVGPGCFSGAVCGLSLTSAGNIVGTNTTITGTSYFATGGGNVGVGTTNPRAITNGLSLTIGDCATQTQPYLALARNSTGGYWAGINWYDNSTRKSFVEENSNFDLRIGTSDTLRLTVFSTGIACFACQVCAGGRISAISSGVDGAFADTFVGIYSGNNNEQNAIQTSVSSIAESSGFLFMVSCGAGLSTRSCGYRMVRNRHTFYVNNSCAVTIDSSGQVGIGTNPGSLLHTSGPSNIFKHFTTTNNGTWIEFQANSTNVVRPFYVGQDNSAGGSFGVGGYAGVVFTSSGDPVVLATASTARLTVAGNGIATFACQVCAPIFTTVNGVAAVGAGPSTTDIFTATGPVSSNGMYLILYNQQGAPGGSTGMAFINIWNNAQVDVYNVYCLGLSNVVNSGTTIRIQSLSGNGGFTAVYSAIRLR